MARHEQKKYIPSRPSVNGTTVPSRWTGLLRTPMHGGLHLKDTPTFRIAQAQALISAPLSVQQNFAQVQGQILTSYTVFAQAQTDVKQIYLSYAQAQALLIKATVHAHTTALIVSTNPYVKAIEASAPVAWWRLDDAGSVAHAIIGPDGNIVGSFNKKIYMPIPVDSAFSGIQGIGDNSQYIQNNLASITNTFTYEVWVSPNRTVTEFTEDPSTNQGTSNLQSFAFFPLNGGGSRGIGLSVGTNAIVAAAHGVNRFYSAATYVGTISAAAHHVVLVIDNKQPYIYLDGVLVHTGTLQTVTNLFTSVMLGGDSSAPSYGPLDAKMSNAAIYDRVLTADEIFTHYQAGMPRGYAQAQALIKRGDFGFAQAQVYLESQKIIQFAQAQADIQTTYQGFAQTQSDIKQVYQTFSQTQAYIKNLVRAHAQARTWIITTSNKVAQAQTLIRIPIAHAQALASIKQTSAKFAQAQAVLATRYWNSAQAQGFVLAIGKKFAQAQARIHQPIWSAQAQAFIKHGNHGHAQVRAKILVPRRGYAQAQARLISYQTQQPAQAQALLNQHFSFGQTEVSIKAGYYSHGLAGTFIALPAGFAQAQVRMRGEIVWQSAQSQTQILTTYEMHAQARTLIRITRRAYAQSQGLIRRQGNLYFGCALAYITNARSSSGQAQVSIAPERFGYGQSSAVIVGKPQGVSQAQAQIGYLNYWIKYNNHMLPGYAQAESLDQTYRILSHDVAYLDGSLNEYLGLENKTISLRMKLIGSNFREVKDIALSAATMLRSARSGYTKMYMARSDRYLLVYPETIKVENTAEKARSIEYTVNFSAKPWQFGETSYTISGTGLLNTGPRSLDAGTWTPAVIKVSGTDITVSGYTEFGQFTGYFSVSGVVTDLTIDTEAYSATIGLVNANNRMNNLDYGVYVGQGRTYFATSGATSVEVTWQNRW